MLTVLFCRSVTFVHFIPVDYIPESGDVVRTFVLVVQVVSVLPYIQTQNRSQTFEERAVLVRCASDGQFTIFTNYEPSPAGTEASCSCFSEIFFEFVIAAQFAIDSCCDIACRAPPPLGPMISQNKLWLACPPPLLRTAVRMPSGTLSRLAIRSSKLFLAVQERFPELRSS